MDTRIKVCFRTLGEREENEITSAIMDYLIWYRDNQTEVDKEIRLKNKEVNNITIVDFWIENIGKNEKLEEMLKNIDIVADSYEFVKKYKSKLMMINNIPDKSVFYKKLYRTSEQAEEMKNLLNEMKNHPEVKKITAYLDKHKLDVNHITSEYAERIIKKCKNLKNAI